MGAGRGALPTAYREGWLRPESVQLPKFSPVLKFMQETNLSPVFLLMCLIGDKFSCSVLKQGRLPRADASLSICVLI